MSDGYRRIMDNVRLDDIAYDPWGASMSWLFGMAEAFWVDFGELLPEFRPAPSLNSRESVSSESYPAELIFDMLDSGSITEDDIKRAYSVLSRYADMLKAAGRSY